MTWDPNQSDEAKESARGAEEDWARWEATFRDARPVLPEVAMERIEAAVRKAAEARTLHRPWYRRRWTWIILFIVTLLSAAVWACMKWL